MSLHFEIGNHFNTAVIDHVYSPTSQRINFKQHHIPKLQLLLCVASFIASHIKNYFTSCKIYKRNWSAVRVGRCDLTQSEKRVKLIKCLKESVVVKLLWTLIKLSGWDYNSKKLLFFEKCCLNQIIYVY